MRVGGDGEGGGWEVQQAEGEGVEGRLVDESAWNFLPIGRKPNLQDGMVQAPAIVDAVIGHVQRCASQRAWPMVVKCRFRFAMQQV